MTLAQWVVESAWGAAMPPGSNNPFGIKAVGDQPAVESRHPRSHRRTDASPCAQFRKFGSLSGRVRSARQAAGDRLAVPARRWRRSHDPDAFADALTGVYATDPQYGFTLKWVMHNYGFIRFDH